MFSKALKPTNVGPSIMFTKTTKSNHGHYLGFTIVELLVVIVIIGILAAIVIVSYMGITHRSEVVSIKSDLVNAARQLEIDKTTNDDIYPLSESEANNGRGLGKSRNTTYQYTSTGSGYCLTATYDSDESIVYHISSSTGGVIEEGACAVASVGDGNSSRIASNSYGNHVCSIASDEKAYCWGYNDYGQLGNGTYDDSMTPILISNGAMPSATVKSIAVGLEHTCVVATNDKIYCWGYNGDGELGNGTNDDSAVPVQVSDSIIPSGEIKSIAAGDYQTCVIASNDNAYCWGHNRDGELGDGTSNDSNVPVHVLSGAMPSESVKSIAAGQYRTCAVASNDKAYCWGNNDEGEFGNGTTDSSVNPTQVLSGAMLSDTVKSISVGVYHTCVVGSDDKPYCWGYNDSGQLGNGTYDSSLLPVAVSSGEIIDLTIKEIKVGGNNTCVINSSDKAYCWGYNDYGQLGNGTYDASSNGIATPVAVLNGDNTSGVFSQIAIGYDRACAVTSDKKAYCWGANDSGELGIGHNNSVFTPVLTLNGSMPTGAVKVISTGSNSACAIASDSNLYCWGSNYYGSIGDGTLDDTYIPVGVLRGAMPTGAIKSVVVSEKHACAIASDDKIYCWGENSSGQLGNGTNNDSYIPVAVSQGAMPTGAIKSIALGAESSCVIASDSKAYCWGYNNSGRLGRVGGNSNVPVAVSQGAMPSTVVKTITSGTMHVCVIASDDKVYCWGYNAYGQIGNNSITSSSVPVLTLNGAMPVGVIKALDAGKRHNCVIASDDKAYCWGDNDYGMLGDGTIIERHIPVLVSQGDMPSGALGSIFTGGDSSCAVASDSKIYCWGRNNNGQVGDNTAVNRTNPSLVINGAMPSGTAKSLSVGGNFSCVIASDDKIYCWGCNFDGQLGVYYRSGVSTRVPSMVLTP